MHRAPAVVAATALTLVLTACLGGPRAGEDVRARPSVPEPAESSAPAPGTIAPPSTPSPTAEPATLTSDGRARHSALSIPRIGVRDLRVVAYRGSPDDGPGTRIQNGGVAASPHGPSGGVGPGGIGNYIVTAHRTSSTRAFADLPRLRRGHHVHVEVGNTRYTYRVVRTRMTSFRSARSLAEQSAAVPGHPGRRPTTAMITLSTCATAEDHARGNHWADKFGNPEHRFDKIGVLVATRPA